MPQRTRSNPASPGQGRLAQVASAPDVLPFLVGAATPLVVLGFLERSYSLLDCSPLTFQLAGGAACASLALGQRLPRGLLRRSLCRVESRWAEVPSGAANAPTVRGIALFATALVALVAGLLVAMLPVALGGVERMLEFARAEFLWHPAMLVALEAVILFAAGVLPLAAVGLLIRSVHQLGGPQRPWQVGTLSSVLFGAAGACVILFAFAPFPLPANRIIQVGAALLLAAALWAARGQTPGRRGVAPAKRRKAQEPESRDDGAALLALGLMVVAGAGACAMLGWVHIVGLFPEAPPQRRYAAAGAILVATAVGLRQATSAGTPGKLRELGRTVVLAGMALAGGTAFFNLVLRNSDALFARTPGHALLWVATGALPFAAVGRAWGMLAAAWVRRSDAPAREGARALRMSGAAVSAAVLVVIVPLVNGLGTYAALVAAALGLVAMGGTLLIHAPHGPQERAWLDVGGVFAAVAVLAVLLPRAGESWLRDRQHRDEQVVESWWGSFALRPGEQVRPLGEDDELTARRVSLPEPVIPVAPHEAIGLFSIAGPEKPPAAGRLRWLAYAPEVAGRCAGGNSPDADIPALRFLRWTHQRYGVLLVDLASLPRSTRQRLASPAFLRRALARLAPGGAVALTIDAASAGDLHTRILDAARRTDSVGWAAVLESAEGQAAGVILASSEPGQLIVREGYRLRTYPLVPATDSSTGLLAQAATAAN